MSSKLSNKTYLCTCHSFSLATLLIQSSSHSRNVCFISGSSFSTTHLATEFKDKCTCRIQPALPQSRSMTLTPMNCACEECQRIRGGAFSIPPPPSPMLGHRSTGGGVRGSARYPSNSNRRVPVGLVGYLLSLLGKTSLLKQINFSFKLRNNLQEINKYDHIQYTIECYKNTIFYIKYNTI